MTVTYNGQESFDEMVTFTDIPNIVKIDDDAGGTKAQIRITVQSCPTVTGDNQYHLTILGETITNVMSYANAKNKYFLMNSSTPIEDVARSMITALRNCATIFAEFDIQMGYSENIRQVVLNARNVGEITYQGGVFETNIPSERIAVNFDNGQAYGAAAGGKVNIDIFDDGDNYVTTLEKNVYKGTAYFNISPVLATFTDYGISRPYHFDISYVTNQGSYNKVGTISGHTVAGYSTNLSDEYFSEGSMRFLRNDNNLTGQPTIWGVYDTGYMPYSVWCPSGTGGFSLTVSAYDSVGDTIYSATTQQRHYGDNRIVDMTASIPTNFARMAFEIGIQAGSMQEIRYRVIRPTKTSERWMRIHWRNEYGGISFFDFTGAIDSTNEIETETYQPSVYDMYERDYHAGYMDYVRQVSKTVTLRTHLMEYNEKFALESLARSRHAWITQAGETYYVNISSISVERDQQYDGIYTGSVNMQLTENI